MDTIQISVILRKFGFADNGEWRMIACGSEKDMQALRLAISRQKIVTYYTTITYHPLGVSLQTLVDRLMHWDYQENLSERKSHVVSSEPS